MAYVRVPLSFVVPTHDPRWPLETRGMNLGKVVSDLRHHRKASLAQSQLDALNELRFHWGVSHDESWKKHLLALKVYRDLHGHVQVPKRFVIPADHEKWPNETHGLKLGNVVNAFRTRKTSLPQNRIEALEALGFDWGVSLEDNWRKNLLALATFEEIYGHLRVPSHFVVPTDDPKWPEATHGMKLPILVYDLRKRRDSLSQNRIDALNFFGFEWDVVG
jgi:hypothetical protein